MKKRIFTLLLALLMALTLTVPAWAQQQETTSSSATPSLC